MWIHSKENWTEFTWDLELISYRLAEIRNRQGYLLGQMQSMDIGLINEASINTITHDITKSSAIEGEDLDESQVRSSIARRLGVNVADLVPSSRYVDGVVEMMLDATQNYSLPLTKTRLFTWHNALFPTGYSGIHKILVGDWRKSSSDPMQVVSGPIGKETIHFEAPSAKLLDLETEKFLLWFETETGIDPVLKAGIAHLWFLTLHPFEDGNGRIARAIADMSLSRADNSKERFYSLSAQIEQDREQYYIHLERQQKSDSNITEWLLWFLNCLDLAITNAENIISHVKYKSLIWNIVKIHNINQRQQLIINRMLEENFEGFMNTSKYAKMAKCSNDTALRDIQVLVSIGVFVKNPGGGRSTSYRLYK